MEAIDKIRDEMAKEKPGSPVAEVGEMVTEMLTAAPEIAPAIMAKGKTLKGAYEAMESAAKKKGGSRVCIGPREAAKIVMEYYGFNAAIPQTPAPAPTPTPAPVKDEFDLDAMLGGL